MRSLPAPIRDTLAAELATCPQAIALSDAERLLVGLVGAPPVGSAGEQGLWTRLFATAPTPSLIAALMVARAALGSAAATWQGLPLTERLPALRRELAQRGLAGFIIPHCDEHQSEFIPAASARLAWLTGFTGSAGQAVLLADKAAIFVDGRYTLQVRDQVDTAAYETLHLIEQPTVDWIAANLPQGAALGIDPWLHGAESLEKLSQAAEKAGGRLEWVDSNPVDAIWTGRPALPIAPVVPHPLEYAGEAAEAKRQRLAEDLAKADVAAAVLAQPDSLAWLLNIRGGDTAHTPLLLGFGILHNDGRVELFCESLKLLPETWTHLGNGVTVAPRAALGDALARLGEAGGKGQADRAATPAWIWDQLKSAGAELYNAPDPCVLPRATKNAAELAGTRAAHARDAVAMARFLAWINANATSGEVGEIQAAEQLLAFRREVPGFRDESFPAISGFGPNGAIVHYRATPLTDRKLAPGSLYLIDSGGQYRDGTTDITRTVAVGDPSEEMRRAFTRVLQGHIDLAMARFPEGTTGAQLDVLARRPLWDDGLDFNHGTGHGVGSYLGVHEGPQRVAKSGTQALLPGMIVSNEPGYYKTDGFGIRTENLLVVRQCEALQGTAKTFLEFETISFAPIDRRLIQQELLLPAERAWIDAYHAQVFSCVAVALDEPTRAWLAAATAPL